MPTPEQIEKATLALKVWPVFVEDPLLADAVALSVLTAAGGQESASGASVADEVSAGGVRRYRHKPFCIDAIRWDGANCVEVFAFLGYRHEPHDDEIDEVLIEQPDGGHLTAYVGDWIVRRDDGRAFKLRHELFIEAYEPVGEVS